VCQLREHLATQFDDGIATKDVARVAPRCIVGDEDGLERFFSRTDPS
jgi:hypothetical protein